MHLTLTLTSLPPNPNPDLEAMQQLDIIESGRERNQVTDHPSHHGESIAPYIYIYMLSII